MMDIPTDAKEDFQCADFAAIYPPCDSSINRFTFKNGHVAVMIHNNVLQFYNNSFERFARFLDLDMKEVKTIVYGSPWGQGMANWFYKEQMKENMVNTPTPYPYDFVNHPTDRDFYMAKFREDIMGFARREGWRGNLLFTSWLSLDPWSNDVLAAQEMIKIAHDAGINASIAFAGDAVRKRINNDWCGPSEECRNVSGGAAHQCIPGTPDVIAWELQSHLLDPPPRLPI